MDHTQEGGDLLSKKRLITHRGRNDKSTNPSRAAVSKKEPRWQIEGRKIRRKNKRKKERGRNVRDKKPCAFYRQAHPKILSRECSKTEARRAREGGGGGDRAKESSEDQAGETLMSLSGQGKGIGV